MRNKRSARCSGGTTAQPMTFEGAVNRKPVTLLPIGRVAHEYYTTYFQMI